MSSKGFSWLVAGLVVGGVLLVAGLGNGWFGGRTGFNPRRAERDAQGDAIAATPVRDPNLPPGPNMKKVGGVWRPISDVEEPTRETSSQQPRAIPSAGSTPVVSPSENASTQLVANALRAARQEPEFGDDKAAALKHLSAMHPADPFDREAYLKDPDAYVQDVQPGRIWQSAPEGPDVKPIERIGDFYREMVSGETAQLKVKVDVGSPATFYSPTLGRFDNKLTTITVRADENGIATANFHAAPGTRGDVTVVVASPVNSQQAKFNLRVVMPDHAGVSPSRQ